MAIKVERDNVQIVAGIVELCRPLVVMFALRQVVSAMAQFVTELECACRHASGIRGISDVR